jgi:hypothetical protein
VKQRGGEYIPGNFEIQFNELFRNGVVEDKLAEVEEILNSEWNITDNMHNTPLLALVKVLYYCYYPEESHYRNTNEIDCEMIYNIIQRILERLSQKNISGPINKKHYTALNAVLDARTYLKEQDLTGYTIHKVLWDIFQKDGNILFQDQLLAIANNVLLDEDGNLRDPSKFNNSTVNAFSIARRNIEEEERVEYEKKYKKNLVIFSDIFRFIDVLQDEIPKTITPMGKKALERKLIPKLKELFDFISKQDESYDFVKDYKKVCSEGPCNFMCNNISPQVKEKLRNLPSRLDCKNKIIPK